MTIYPLMFFLRPWYEKTNPNKFNRLRIWHAPCNSQYISTQLRSDIHHNIEGDDYGNVYKNE